MSLHTVLVAFLFVILDTHRQYSPPLSQALIACVDTLRSYPDSLSRDSSIPLS